MRRPMRKMKDSLSVIKIAHARSIGPITTGMVNQADICLFPFLTIDDFFKLKEKCIKFIKKIFL